MSKRRDSAVIKILSYLIVAIAIIFALFPVFWTFGTAFKNPVEVYHSPPIWIPSSLGQMVDNVIYTVGAGSLTVLRNSLIVTIPSTLLATLIGALTGYSLVRFRTGGNFLPFWILSQRMLPPIAFIIPIFLVFQPLGLINTYQGLILTYTAFTLPYAVWMMRGFIADIPLELEESAMVDGCGRMRAFVKIILPLVVPGLVATAIFVFVLNWNEFLFALVLMRSKANFTIPVGQYVFYWGPTSGFYWGPASIQALMAIIPVLALSIYIQKYLVRGLTFGAVKG